MSDNPSLLDYFKNIFTYMYVEKGFRILKDAKRAFAIIRATLPGFFLMNSLLCYRAFWESNTSATFFDAEKHSILNKYL